MFEKLFGNKNKKEPEVIDNLNENENEEDEEELIAVITAAVSAVLKKPASGFKVVSFKKREGWKLM